MFLLPAFLFCISSGDAFFDEMKLSQISAFLMLGISFKMLTYKPADGFIISLWYHGAVNASAMFDIISCLKSVLNLSHLSCLNSKARTDFIFNSPLTTANATYLFFGLLFKVAGLHFVTFTESGFGSGLVFTLMYWVTLHSLADAWLKKKSTKFCSNLP